MWKIGKEMTAVTSFPVSVYSTYPKASSYQFLSEQIVPCLAMLTPVSEGNELAKTLELRKYSLTEVNNVSTKTRGYVKSLSCFRPHR